MAANKDKDKKSGHSSSGVGGTSIHKSTKSVTFATDRSHNESASSPHTQIVGLIPSSTIPQPPGSKNTNRNVHEYHHSHRSQPHYHNSNNSSSSESTTEDSSGGSGAEDNYSSLSDQLDNLAEPSGSCDACDSSSIRIYELPENVIENIFSYLPLRDLRTVTFVCTDWARIINNENNEIWRSHCLTKLHPEALRSPTLLTGLLTFKSKLRAFYHGWNPNDCSRNIFVKPNGFTIHRNPVAQSTDGVRGKVGFTQGRHAWEVIWEGPLGTVAVVGIATRGAEMRAQGYVPLLGQDEQSWGWNLVENTLLHNGDSQGNYPVINNAPRYQVGERIRVILDCEDSTLSFEKDNEFYGVAFRGLPSTEPLYPAISAVYGNTEVSMVYLGPPLDG